MNKILFPLIQDIVESFEFQISNIKTTERFEYLVRKRLEEINSYFSYKDLKIEFTQDKSNIIIGKTLGAELKQFYSKNPEYYI